MFYGTPIDNVMFFFHLFSVDGITSSLQPGLNLWLPVSYDWNEVCGSPVDIIFWVCETDKFSQVVTMVDDFVVFYVSIQPKMTFADPTKLCFLRSFW